MSRDHKILIAAALAMTIVAVAKSAPTSTDDAIAAVKAEAIPVAVNVGALFILFKIIK
jgi:hypothetical protein